MNPMPVRMAHAALIGLCCGVACGTVMQAGASPSPPIAGNGGLGFQP
ncbi:hypothetical protein ACUHMQ_12690 [Chitinimonas sp. PSY-7]